MSYGFRIRFILLKGSVIQHDTDTLAIEFPSSRKAILIQSATGIKLKDSNNCIIRGSGFSSADEAFACGRKTKNALIIACAGLGLSIDVGEDKASSGVSRIIKDEARKAGFILLNDVHGLCIYPEDLPVSFSCTGGTPGKSASTVAFVKELSQVYENAPELNPRQSLAFELYSLAQATPSKRSRFLLFMDAFECLPGSDGQVEAFIDSCRPVKTSLLDQGSAPSGADMETICQKLEETFCRFFLRTISAG